MQRRSLRDSAKAVLVAFDLDRARTAETEIWALRLVRYDAVAAMILRHAATSVLLGVATLASAVMLPRDARA